jgi:pyrroloquinoline quinone (PQQ) biosynthesis protein C
MDRIGILEKEWLSCFKRMRQGKFFQLLASKRLERAHYMGFLRETYHNASHNPKNMALFMAHLHSDRRQLEAKFLKHTAAEIGHDELALDDLKVLGGDAESVRHGRPLPTTEALAGFIVFQIQHRNPLAYLGYLYHLEAMPVHFGGEVMECLLAAGIPLEATTFLREHAEADPVHVKWNREYIEGFIRDDEDMEAVLYGLRGTCELHGGMFQGILDHAQDWSAAPARGAATADMASAKSPSRKAIQAP